MTDHMNVDLGGGRHMNVPVDLPGNSYKERAEKKAQADTPEKNVERIVTGTVVTRKKGLLYRFGDSMTGDTSEGVLQYVVMDVLLPAAKSMIVDAVSQGVERLLYGEQARVRSRNDRPGGYVNYNRVAPRRPEYNTITTRARASHDFDEVIMPSRGEAEDVLDRMRELISQFEVVTVADFYDLCGITADFPDDKWGWYDLRHAIVRHTRGGYLISLPKSQPID